jgi:hypothetical protein
MSREIGQRELRRIDSPELIDLLIARLADDSSAVQIYTINALIELGALSRVTDLLITMLEDKHPIVRSNAARALAGIKEPRVTAALLANLNDKDVAFRSMIIRVVGRNVGEEASAILVEMLNHEREDSALVSIIEALADISDQRATDALISKLGTPGFPYRGTIVEALGHVGTARAIEVLMQLLRDEKDPDVVVALLRTLSPEQPSRIAPAPEPREDVRDEVVNVTEAPPVTPSFPFLVHLFATYPVSGGVFVGVATAVATAWIAQQSSNLSVLTVGTIGTLVGLLAYAGWNAATEPRVLEDEDDDDAPEVDNVRLWRLQYQDRSRRRTMPSRSLPKVPRRSLS